MQVLLGVLVLLAPGVRCFCSLRVRTVSLLRDAPAFDETAEERLTPGQVLDVITSSTPLPALQETKRSRSLRVFDEFQTGGFIWQQDEEQTLSWFWSNETFWVSLIVLNLLHKKLICRINTWHSSLSDRIKFFLTPAFFSQQIHKLDHFLPLRRKTALIKGKYLMQRINPEAKINKIMFLRMFSFLTSGLTDVKFYKL